MEISKKEFITEACQALSLSEKEFLSHAKTIIAEWKISSPANFLPENTPKAHLVNQMRIKRDSPTESKAQSRFCDTVKRKQAEQAKKQEELKEKAEPRGAAGLQAFLRSNGIQEGGSVLSMLSRPTEAEALAEFKTLNSN